MVIIKITYSAFGYIQDLENAVDEMIRISSRGLIEMDYLKDEKKRTLTDMGLDPEDDTVMDVPLDTLIQQLLDQNQMKINKKYNFFLSNNNNKINSFSPFF